MHHSVPIFLLGSNGTCTENSDSGNSSHTFSTTLSESMFLSNFCKWSNGELGVGVEKLSSSIW